MPIDYQTTALALLLGDAHAAPYEGGPLERGLWKLIGRKKGQRRYTDDTQMALDLGHHLATHGRIHHQELLGSFAQSYRWSRGYGPSTVAVLKLAKRGVPWQQAATHRHTDGSFGNGAAMRIAMVPIFLHGKANVTALLEMVREASEVTHPNALAIDGAIIIALAIWLGFEGVEPSTICQRIGEHLSTDSMRERCDTVHSWLAAPRAPTISEAAASLGAGTAAIESCPLALFIGLHLSDHPFQNVLNAAIATRGDTDTIAAMAGAVWGRRSKQQQLTAELIAQTEGVNAINTLVDALREKPFTRVMDSHC